MRKYCLPHDIGVELKVYLLLQGKLVHLVDDLYIHGAEWGRGVERLYKHGSKILTPAEAKEILGISRKYLIPFLESLDRVGLTRREGVGRIWLR